MHRSYLENLERRFLEANELTTAEEQEEYLSTLSAHDEQMADELRMLLALRTEATSMFDSDHEECFSLLLTTLGESKRIESKEELLDFLSETSPAESPGSMATIRGYSLVELVGTGPTGFVFRGWDPVMKRAVAIKVLAPSISCVAERRNVFLQEASLAGSVEHKNVCTIYHVSSEFDSNLVFYVAEWVQGETMDRWIRKQEVFPNDESIRFLVQLIHGVGAIHAKGIVHRDLKPGNLMLDSEREVLRIIDFGLAHEGSLTSANQLPAGTPMYMSPEQMRGERLTQSSDLFALGCIASVLITGFHPFESDSLKGLSINLLERGPRLDQACYQQNPGLMRVMRKALSELPSERFSSAESFGDALFSVLTPSQKKVWQKTGQNLVPKIWGGVQ